MVEVKSAEIIPQTPVVGPEKHRLKAKILAAKNQLYRAAVPVLLIALVAACGEDEEDANPKSATAVNQEPIATQTVDRMPAETAVATPRLPDPTPKPLAPTATPQPSEPTITPEIRVDKAQFIFGEDVPENLRREIRDGVNMGVSWLAKKSGVNLEGVSVFAYGSPDKVSEAYFRRKGGDPRTLDQIKRDLAHATAFAGSQKDFYILTSSPGWTRASPIIGGPVVEGRYHTTFHELFHVLQYEVKGYNIAPLGWLNEGGAHYIAARALDENGIYSYEAIKKGHLSRAGFFRESLARLEDQNLLANVDNYSLSFLAMDLLTRDLSEKGVPALVRYWREIGMGSGPDAAFIIAFGKTRPEFYAVFEAWRVRGFQ